MFTHFWDMHSGGDSKEDQQHIYIEAPQAEAEVIFANRFGHDPHRVSCECCGEDYSVSESETLEEATEYFRLHDYKAESKWESLDAYLADNAKDVMVIRASEITAADREGLPKGVGPSFVIRNKVSGLFWSNQWGWGSLEGCEAFDDKTMNLPVDGEWVECDETLTEPHDDDHDEHLGYGGGDEHPHQNLSCFL